MSSIYSLWMKSGLSSCRSSIRITMRHNLLSTHYRNVTKEAAVESVFNSRPFNPFNSNFPFPSRFPSFPSYRLPLILLLQFRAFTLSQKYDLYRLDKGPLEKSTLTVEDATYALKTMNYIRRMENRAAELYRQRLINGFLHLYVGQVDERNLDSKAYR